MDRPIASHLQKDRVESRPSALLDDGVEIRLSFELPSANPDALPKLPALRGQTGDTAAQPKATEG